MPENKLLVRLLSPERSDGRDEDDRRVGKAELTADMVIMRCITGDWGVLPGHEPRMAVLEGGRGPRAGDGGEFGLLRVVTGDEETRFRVYGGIAEVRGRAADDGDADDVLTVVTVLSGYAETADAVIREK